MKEIRGAHRAVPHPDAWAWSGVHSRKLFPVRRWACSLSAVTSTTVMGASDCGLRRAILRTSLHDGASWDITGSGKMAPVGGAGVFYYWRRPWVVPQ